MTRGRRVTWAIGLLTVVVLIAEVTAVTVAGTFADRLYAGVVGCIALTTTGLVFLVARRQPGSVVAPRPVASATCSRTGSSTSATSSTPYVASAPVGPRSTPRWCLG